MSRIEVTGYGATPADAERDAKRKLSDELHTDGAYDDAANAAIGAMNIGVALLIGYPMLAGALIGIFFARPLAAVIVAVSFAACFSIGYDIVYPYAMSVGEADGTIIGIFKIMGINFLGLIFGSLCAGIIAHFMGQITDVIELAETKILYALSGFIRAPLMVASAFTPTFVFVLAWLDDNDFDRQAALQEMFSFDGFGDYCGWVLFAVMQVTVICYRAGGHPLAAEFTWYGMRRAPKAEDIV